MAQLRMASRASFRSEHIRVAARMSISVTVRRRARRPADRDGGAAAELREYRTPAELVDLAAVLDRYPDEDTAEIREALAGRRG